MSEKVECFEDLIAWQKARVLAGRVHRLTRERPLANDFALARQLQRAGVSIMSNVAEGFERNYLREFGRYLLIANGSCAELRSHFYLAHDIDYLKVDEFNALMGQAKEVARIVAGLERSIRDRRTQ